MLNKFDLFADYITRVPLSVAFPHYAGPGSFEHKVRIMFVDDADEAVEFIKQEFIVKVPKNIQVYMYRVHANDTNHCKIVWRAIKDVFVYQCASLA